MDNECSFPDCGRDRVAHGLCATHYAQKSRGKELTPIRPRSTTRVETVCAFEPCGRMAETKGWCHSHYAQQHRGRPLSAITPPLSTEGTCEIDGCEFRIESRRLCSAHYQRARRRARREAAREGE